MHALLKYKLISSQNRHQMSRNLGEMDAEEVDEACFKEFVAFCREMWLSIPVQTWKGGVLSTGSSAELPGMCGFENATDLDTMIELPDVIALPAEVDVGAMDDKTTVVRIDTHGVHSGFARLTRKDGTNLTNDSLHRESTAIQRVAGVEQEWQGPSIESTKSKLKWCQPLLDHFKIGPTSNFSKTTSGDRHSDKESINDTFRVDMPMDIVLCVRCPYWPNEAAEWIRRQRRSGWPSAGLVDKVSRGGCHFVCVGHKLSSVKGNEYRFSFSKAEALLISNWSLVQVKVYQMLKLTAKLVKELMGGAKLLLCSYYLKTLMFWSCEERPSQFWEEHQIANSTHKLWLCVIGWMTQKQCSNYFITSNNMMDVIDLDSSRYGRELFFLDAALKHVPSIVRGSAINYASNRSQLSVPSWYINTTNLHQYYTHPFRLQQPVEVSSCLSGLESSLVIDLSDLYRGLYLNWLAVAKVRCPVDRERCLVSAERHLHAATKRDKHGRRIRPTKIFNFDQCEWKEIAEEYADFFHPKKWNEYKRFASSSASRCTLKKESLIRGSQQYGSTCDALNWRRDCDCDRLMRYNSNTTDTVSASLFEASESENEAILAKEQMFTNDVNCKYSKLRPNEKCDSSKSSADDYNECQFAVWREWTEMSNSEIAMDIYLGCTKQGRFAFSMQCSKVYLANFLYSIRKDFKQAIRWCDSVIDKFSSDTISKDFHQLSWFRVLIATRFVPLFDAEIQTVVGFVTLCRGLSADRRRADRSVTMAICPGLFAAYIKARCLVEMGDNSERAADAIKQVKTYKSLNSIFPNVMSPEHSSLVKCALCAVINKRNRSK